MVMLIDAIMRQQLHYAATNCLLLKFYFLHVAFRLCSIHFQKFFDVAVQAIQHQSLQLWLGGGQCQTFNDKINTESLLTISTKTHLNEARVIPTAQRISFTLYMTCISQLQSHDMIVLDLLVSYFVVWQHCTGAQQRQHYVPQAALTTGDLLLSQHMNTIPVKENKENN